MNKNNVILYPFSRQLMFAKVMEDAGLCRDMLRLIFPDREVKDLIVHKREVSASEVTVITGMESKSVRLDVLFDDAGGWYDIELQVEDKKNLPKRSRYYSAALDVNRLKRGEDYSKLPPSYVIFICLYDEMGIDEPVYSFQMFDERYSLPLNDESYTIILNARCSTGKVPENLRPLFEYLKTGDAVTEDDFIRRIDAKVREFQDDEEVKRMMSVEDEMRLIYENRLEQGIEQAKKEFLKQGLEQGTEQTKREMARVMKADNKPVEEISKYTGLSIKEIEALE